MTEKDFRLCFRCEDVKIDEYFMCLPYIMGNYDMEPMLASPKNLLSEKIKDKDALGQVFANENFTQAITASIENKTSPEKDLTEIITFMNNALERPEVLEKLSNDGLSPENVRNGFKSAIVEYIAIKGEKGDLTDFDAMIKALNEPLLNAPSQDRTNIGEQARDIAQKFPTSQILPSTKNLGQILIENNVFSQAEIDRLNYVLEVGKNVNIAQMTGDSSNISEGMSDNMLAFASWLGAGSIGRFSENVPFLRPQGLVEAGIGARIARRLFSKGPINIQIRMSYINFSILNQTRYDYYGGIIDAKKTRK